MNKKQFENKARQFQCLIKKYASKLKCPHTCKSKKQIAKAHFELNKYRRFLEKLAIQYPQFTLPA